jgi:hypothetical protein
VIDRSTKGLTAQAASACARGPKGRSVEPLGLLASILSQLLPEDGVFESKSEVCAAIFDYLE